MEELESQLAAFSTAIQAVSEDPERPKTAFELLSSARFEGAWQSYLGYFLDPNESHGLRSTFLVQFFDLLEEHDAVSFSPTRTAFHSKETIDVALERQSEDDNRPDIVITSGSEWFLCLELKVHSSEGSGETAQTVRYANDSDIVPYGTKAYEDGDYLYLKPKNEPDSTSKQFSDVDWQDVQIAVNQTIAQSSGDVSTRTLAQLSDFSTLIDSQLTMTKLDEATRQRKDLYFQHRQEIKEAQDAVEPFVKKVLQQEWGKQLTENYSPANYDEFQWLYQAIGNGYGQVRAPEWKSAKHGDQKLDIHWEHKPTTGDFQKGQLRCILELEEPNRSTMDHNSGERYHKFRNDLLGEISDVVSQVADPRWDDWEKNPGSSQKKLARFVYEYQPGDEDGYYQALKFALEDTHPVSTLVTKTLESTDYTVYPVE